MATRAGTFGGALAAESRLCSRRTLSRPLVAQELSSRCTLVRCFAIVRGIVCDDDDPCGRE